MLCFKSKIFQDVRINYKQRYETLKFWPIFEPTCAICTVGSYVSLSVCLLSVVSLPTSSCIFSLSEVFLVHLSTRHSRNQLTMALGVTFILVQKRFPQS